MPKVKINGVEVEVPEGTNMIEAARVVGVEIPHYCYHPHLTIAGNCRMCLVDIEAGGRGPDIACNMQAKDGLEIRTDTAQVAQMRKSVMEFLLVNHPLDCPICDQSGECRLQDYYMDHAGHESRMADPKVTKAKRQDIGEHILLDGERCVSCTRCVRFGDEVTGTGELRLFNRTDHTEIGIFPGVKLSHQYQGNLADICPVGALTNKEFRFKKRVWYLKETDSLCDGCATGCNITVGHENGEVFRYLPRRNDNVNNSWMCDPGRSTHEKVGGLDRILRASVDGTRTTVDRANQAAAELLSGDKVAVVLGNRATNEANWALLGVAKHIGASVYTCLGNDPDAGEDSDDLLISADKNPNTTGATTLAAYAGAADRDALAAALGAGEITTLLALEDDVLGRLGIELGQARLVFVGAFQNASSKAAAIVLPAAAQVEQDATYTNKNGRVQRLFRSIHPAGDSQPTHRVLDALGAAAGRPSGPAKAAVAFAELADAVKGFAGMTYKTLGNQGQDLGSASTPPDGPAAAPPAK